jgi:hypothetical protein
MYSTLSFKREGSVIGHWVKVVQPVQFVQGYNDLVLLSQTVGLQVKVHFVSRQDLNVFS